MLDCFPHHENDRQSGPELATSPEGPVGRLCDVAVQYTWYTWGEADKLQVLIESLQNTDWYVRQRAAWELGRQGNPDAVLPLIEALQDESKEVRDRAREALQHMDSEEMPLILKVLLHEKVETLQRLEVFVAVVRIRRILIASAVANGESVDDVEEYCLNLLDELEALGRQADADKAVLLKRAERSAAEVLAAYRAQKDAGMLLRAGDRDFALEQGELLRGVAGGAGTIPDQHLLQAASAPATPVAPSNRTAKRPWRQRPERKP